MSRERGAATVRDEGFTLVEVLVAMGLFALVGTLLLGLSLSTSRVTDDTREISALSERSRLAMERLSRDLRQAAEITKVSVGADGQTELEFWTDFDGNRSKPSLICPAADPSKMPEILNYKWAPSADPDTDPDAGILTIAAPDFDEATLTEGVVGFSLRLGSVAWGGAGTTLKVPGEVATSELDLIDRVEIELTIRSGERTQTYKTIVHLRNQPLEDECQP